MNFIRKETTSVNYYELENKIDDISTVNLCKQFLAAVYRFSRTPKIYKVYDLSEFVTIVFYFERKTPEEDKKIISNSDIALLFGIVNEKIRDYYHGIAYHEEILYPIFSIDIQKSYSNDVVTRVITTTVVETTSFGKSLVNHNVNDDNGFHSRLYVGNSDEIGRSHKRPFIGN